MALTLDSKTSMQIKTSTIFFIIFFTFVVPLTAIPYWTQEPTDEIEIRLDLINDGTVYEYTVTNLTKNKVSKIRYDISLRKRVDVTPGNNEITVVVTRKNGKENIFSAGYNRVNTVKKWPNYYVLEFKNETLQINPGEGEATTDF